MRHPRHHKINLFNNTSISKIPAKIKYNVAAVQGPRPCSRIYFMVRYVFIVSLYLAALDLVLSSPGLAARLAPGGIMFLASLYYKHLNYSTPTCLHTELLYYYAKPNHWLKAQSGKCRSTV